MDEYKQDFGLNQTATMCEMIEFCIANRVNETFNVITHSYQRSCIVVRYNFIFISFNLDLSFET